MFETVLSLETIRNFFITHNIGLEEERSLTKLEVYDLAVDAVALGHTFLCFFVNTIINADKDGLQTVFDSYDSVLEAYLCFHAGYNKRTGN
jgi:hypothetical protein